MPEFKKHIEDVVEIDAPPEAVWQTLTDFQSWPEWNPFIEMRGGSLSLGSKVQIFVKTWGPKGAVVGATVIRNDGARDLAWRGGAPVPGLFTGEHYFRIEPAGDGKSRHIHGENYNGLLLPLLSARIDRDLGPMYGIFNQALKARVEGARVSPA